jgi:hypothetical protein
MRGWVDISTDVVQAQEYSGGIHSLFLFLFKIKPMMSFGHTKKLYSSLPKMNLELILSKLKPLQVSILQVHSPSFIVVQFIIHDATHVPPSTLLYSTNLIHYNRQTHSSKEAERNDASEIHTTRSEEGRNLPSISAGVQ